MRAREPGKTEEPIETFARHALTERKRLLMAGREAAERGGRELFEEREPDWEDQAGRESAAKGLEGVADNERAQLTRVMLALERLDQGEWGRCVTCGEPIAEARLRAAPEVSRCSGCTNHH